MDWNKVNQTLKKWKLSLMEKKPKLKAGMKNLETLVGRVDKAYEKTFEFYGLEEPKRRKKKNV